MQQLFHKRLTSMSKFSVQRKRSKCSSFTKLDWVRWTWTRAAFSSWGTFESANFKESRAVDSTWETDADASWSLSESDGNEDNPRSSLSSLLLSFGWENGKDVSLLLSFFGWENGKEEHPSLLGIILGVGGEWDLSPLGSSWPKSRLVLFYVLWPYY